MLTDLFQKGRRRVLLYCRGAFHFPLLEPLVRGNPDIEFCLHSNLFGKDVFLGSSLAGCANLCFVASLDELRYRLGCFGAFITTDAQSVRAHRYALKIVRIMARMGTPVFEIQHGMFQLGLHYYDVPGKAEFRGDSLPARSLATRILACYPVEDVREGMAVIGYPPFDGTRTPDAGGNGLLVLTNLHWGTYTDDERREFYTAVFDHLQRNPDATAVWRQHHAEIASPVCAALLGELRRSHPSAATRIRMCHEDKELARLSLPELIRAARVVVSTVSTVLWDCEIASKPVAVYTCPSVDCLTRRLRSASFFSSRPELSELLSRMPEPLESGILVPYDNQVFRHELDVAYAETRLSGTEYLELVFGAMQPTGDEVNWSVSAVKQELVQTGLRLGQSVGDALRNAETQARTAQSALSRETALREAAERRLEAEAVCTAGLREELGRQSAEKASLQTEVADGRRLAANLEKALETIRGSVKKLEGDLETERGEALRLRNGLEAERGAKERLRKDLEAVNATARRLRKDLETERAAARKLQRDLEAERQALCDSQVKHERERRALIERNRLGSQLRRMVACLLPYGPVCAWRRMAHGVYEDAPLFAYPGVGKRVRRLVKFVLPYGVVRLLKR